MNVLIVGLACRVPGARGPQALADMLRVGTHAFMPLPPDRLDPAVYAAELPEDLPTPLLGALLNDFELDWRQLRMPPLQVSKMHRMERAAFGTMIEALMDAGIQPDNALADRARVFVAASTLGPDPLIDQGLRIRRFELASPIEQALNTLLPAEAPEIARVLERLFDDVAPKIEPDSMRVSASITAGRVANLFDFNAGHVAVDAAFTSSLAAVQEAVSAIEAGDCDVALVGALSPLITPFTLAAFAHTHDLAATPPHPNASNGSGTLLGEGCAAIVLAREGALPGSKPYARIAGIASSLAARDDEAAIADAISTATAMALEKAGDVASAVAVVETRASGIIASDASEAHALRDAYAAATSRRNAPPPVLSSAVGSVGFLQAASGMVALVHAAWTVSDRNESAGESSSSRAVGVSDAGLGTLAAHAVLASPKPAARPSTPSRLSGSDSPSTEIAIVGMGLSLPRATSLEGYWRNIVDRIEAVGDFPPSRWDVDKLIGSGADVGAILKTRLAAVVDTAELDEQAVCGLDPAVALAFRSASRALADVQSKREAIDPLRARVVFGQIPLRAAEADAERRILFAGHLNLAAHAMREVGVEEDAVEAVIAEARRYLHGDGGSDWTNTMSACSGFASAAQVAEANGFRGGALSVDAACASSLAAVEIGVRALRNGSADFIVAGGVAFNLLPEYYITLSMLGALSPRAVPAFHAGAQGFVPAEGAGAVVLKRLGDARRDGDRVYAVIGGIGVASDGRGPSIFASSTVGQQRAIRRALAYAGADAASIDLIEAHGAGTPLGDRTEIESYAATYASRPWGAPVTIGSVKSQIGHLSSAAGIAGLIKTALALRQRTFPSSGGDGELDPSLPVGQLQMNLATRSRPWIVPPGRPRRAAVSAFGLGGVNYHVVLQEADYIAAQIRRTLPVSLVHPAPLPARGTWADRFRIAMVPLALPDRPPRFPLAGRRMLVVQDAGSYWKSVVRVIEARGAKVIVLERDATVESLAKGLGEEWTKDIDGVIDLSAFAGESGELQLSTSAIAASLRETALRSFSVLRALHDRIADAERPSAVVAVTSLGGDLGLSGAADAAIDGAYLLGLVKALKQELPHVVARTIDFRPSDAPDVVSELVASEIEDGGDRMEVGYSGGRHIPNLVRADFAEDDPVIRPLVAGDVALVSGGGRGVLFECASGLSRLGLHVIVTGRTPLADSDAEWLDLDDDAFEAFRRNELARRFREDRTLTPVRFAREFEVVVRQRELHRNLERARADELPIVYERCDVTSASDVRDLTLRVRATWGRIDVVVHGAMIEHSTKIARKTDDLIERTMSAKAVGILNLIDALADAPPSVLLAFGSGAGRFGNRGQSDYAAANAVMAALLTGRGRRLLPTTHCVTVDWTAWASVGAAAKPEMKAVIEALRLTSIRPEEGIYWFLSELGMGLEPEVVIMEERMLHDWAFLGATADGSGEFSVEADDSGVPLVSGRWPMIDRITGRQDDRLVMEAHLHPEKHTFLNQHKLNGVPILPFTFGCELAAEAAALSAPGWTLDRLEHVRVETPVKFFNNAGVDLRVIVRVKEQDDDRRTVIVETRSDLFLKGKPLQLDRLHHVAQATLRKTRRAAQLPIEIPERPGVLTARSIFEGATNPVELGPIFCGAAWIQVVGREVIGSVRPRRQRSLFRGITMPVFQLDPLTLDSAFQIAANWDAQGSGMVSIPISVERIVPGERREIGQSARVRAVMIRTEDQDVIYDLVIATEQGAPLAKVSGLRLRRVGPIERGHE